VYLGPRGVRVPDASSASAGSNSPRGPDQVLLAPADPLYDRLTGYGNTSDDLLVVAATARVRVRDLRTDEEKLMNWPLDATGRPLSPDEFAVRITAESNYSRDQTVIVMSCPLPKSFVRMGGYCKDAAGCVKAQHHKASLNNAIQSQT